MLPSLLLPHSAPSPAGDLTDSLARAWWHHNVPSLHWHPRALVDTNNTAMLPALIEQQGRLVGMLNDATGALAADASWPRHDRRVRPCWLRP